MSAYYTEAILGGKVTVDMLLGKSGPSGTPVPTGENTALTNTDQGNVSVSGENSLSPSARMSKETIDTSSTANAVPLPPLGKAENENPSAKVSNEKVEALKERIEAKKIDEYCRENVEDYDGLKEADRSMVRKVIREGRAHGLSEADVLSYARVAAHTGINIEYDANMKDGDAGYYDPKANKIVVNPKAEKKQELILIHELDHAVRKLVDLGENVRTLVYEGAEKGLSNETWERIKKDYADQDVDVSREELLADEASAYYTEAILGGKVTVDMLLEDNSTLKKKILNFFSSAARAYSKDEKLSRAARRHYKSFKAMFDAFAKANKGRNAETAVATVDNGKLTVESEKSVRKASNTTAKLNSARYDFSKSFAEQVDDYKNGRFPPRDTLIVGATPDVWKQVGFNALPVTINQTHVDYAINGTKDSDHTIGEALLKALPDAIKDPVAIIQSQSPTRPDRAVVIFKTKHKGKNVVGAIEVDGEGYANRISIDSNAMTSLFAKTNALQQLKKAVDNTVNGGIELFYWDKKEAVSLLQNAGLQLSGTLPQDGFVYSIHEKGSKVNTKIKNVTESQQFVRWFGDWKKNPKKASKVVNEDGTPMVVYHGTNAEFWTFEKGHKRTRGRLNLGDGFYFGAKKSRAEAYVESSNGKVMEVYVNIKKPYEVIGPSFTEFEMDDIRSKLSAEDRAKLNYDNVNEYLEKLGYDGIIGYDYSGTKKSIDQVVAFKPEQIKSATDNIGTFDGENKDIRFSKDITPKVAEESGIEKSIGKLGEGKIESVMGRDAKVGARRASVLSNRRANMTVGQMRQMIARYTGEKVYTSKEARETIDNIYGIYSLSQKIRAKLYEALWQGYNACKTDNERAEFSYDMAEYVAVMLLSESSVENPDRAGTMETISKLNISISSPRINCRESFLFGGFCGKGFFAYVPRRARDRAT